MDSLSMYIPLPHTYGRPFWPSIGTFPQIFLHFYISTFLHFYISIPIFYISIYILSYDCPTQLGGLFTLTFYQFASNYTPFYLYHLFFSSTFYLYINPSFYTSIHFYLSIYSLFHIKGIFGVTIVFYF